MISREEFQSELAKSRAGCQEAWGRLVLAFHPYLTRQARMLAGQPAIGKDRPSDTVQATVVRALERCAQFAGKTPEEFQNWLSRLVETVSSNQARRHQRWQSDDGLDALPDAAPSLETLLYRQEMFDHLPRYLSEEELLVVGLWLDGWSWPEVGAKLGTPPDAARMLKTRAIPQLAKAMFEFAAEHGQGSQN